MPARAPQYTDTTDLWEAAQALLLSAEGCRRAGQTDVPESSHQYVLVPHAALDAVLVTPGAQPEPPLSDAQLAERLQPFLRNALYKLDPQLNSSGRRPSAGTKRIIDAARNAIVRLMGQRGIAFSERLACIQQVLDSLLARSAEMRQQLEQDQEREDYNPRWYSGDSIFTLRSAEVQLEDAISGARIWLREREGRTVPPRTQLLELLRAARDGGEDVLVYHNVC